MMGNMKFDSNTHNRQSLRWPGCDYSQKGAYVVTICTQKRRCLFGSVEDEKTILNGLGETVFSVWLELANRFPGIILDKLVVMPNHVHGILFLSGAASSAPTENNDKKDRSYTLGEVIRAFKSISAIQVNRQLGVKDQPLWQRNYYDHVIRDQDDLNRVRQYVLDNPINWEQDKNNPKNW